MPNFTILYFLQRFGKQIGNWHNHKQNLAVGSLMGLPGKKLLKKNSKTQMTPKLTKNNNQNPKYLYCSNHQNSKSSYLTRLTNNYAIKTFKYVKIIH